MKKIVEWKDVGYTFRSIDLIHEVKSVYNSPAMWTPISISPFPRTL
jgi:hypothetical protein